MPGLVSTLLKYTYSVPGRLVHTCLHVTEQVWQPMHLSRFITIDICAMTLTSPNPCSSRDRSSDRPFCSSRERSSELNLLGAATDDGDLVTLVAGRAVVVEPVGQLRIAADHV